MYRDGAGETRLEMVGEGERGRERAREGEVRLEMVGEGERGREAAGGGGSFGEITHLAINLFEEIALPNGLR